MNKILVLLGLLLIVGCIGELEVAEEEVKLDTTKGVGVLEFKPIVNEMLTETYNYILLSVRNNAEGNSADNIIVSLENLEPFWIYECGEEWSPNTNRESTCNDFFNDFGIPYSKHAINKMFPNEEIQFFWNIKSPSNAAIASMKYDHTVYYTLEYAYATTVTQTIAAISQEEYLDRSKEGPVILTGQTINSPGELKLESTTQQPLIYVSGTESSDFTLEFNLNNAGNGIIKPGSEIIIALKKDSLTNIDEVSAESLGWVNYSSNTNEIATDFDNLFPYNEYGELGVEGGEIRDNLWLFKISSDQLVGGKYSLIMPVSLDSSNLYEPQKILTFTAYISYNYLKEGSTTISVYPSE